MELTAFARWLNTAFAEFDYAILEFYHTLAVHAAPILTPLMEFLSFIGDGGLFCFCLAAVLVCFPTTRRAGCCILISIALGAVLTNLTLKELIGRPRPFNADPLLRDWWSYVGAPRQGELSFPSGHVTSTMACMTGVCLSVKKKWYVLLPAALYVILMGAARNYLMVHYPSDVLGGLIVGGVAGVLGWLILRAIWQAMERHRDNTVCRFLLEADIRSLKTNKE